LHIVNTALLPFAVTCTLLYLGLSLLPFAPDGISWGEALSVLPGQLNAGELSLLPLLLVIPLGFFWQGVVWPRVVSARPAAAVAVFLAYGVLAVLLQLGQIYFSPRLVAPSGMAAPALGFVAGMVLWWLFGSLLSRSLLPLPKWLWPLLVVFSVLSVLLPFQFDAPLSAPVLPESVAAYLVEIPQRFYQLIKSAILWAPVGFLYTLSGRGGELSRWGVALFVALLLQGLPLLHAQPLLESLELVFALPGLWVGAWLAARSVQRATRDQSDVVDRPGGHSHARSRHGVRRR
jgi:hypothetical protein